MLQYIMCEIIRIRNPLPPLPTIRIHVLYSQLTSNASSYHLGYSCTVS
jgi:hypothetical protein